MREQRNKNRGVTAIIVRQIERRLELGLDKLLPIVWRGVQQEHMTSLITQIFGLLIPVRIVLVVGYRLLMQTRAHNVVPANLRFRVLPVPVTPPCVHPASINR